MLGLYDQRGMLRYAGHGRAECMAYAELFGLAEGSFCLEPLFATAFPLADVLDGGRAQAGEAVA